METTVQRLWEDAPMPMSPRGPSGVHRSLAGVTAAPRQAVRTQWGLSAKDVALLPTIPPVCLSPAGLVSQPTSPLSQLVSWARPGPLPWRP